MRVGDLIELLKQFDSNLPMVVMLPPEGAAIGVEVVSVQRARYMPADALVGLGDVVLMRAVNTPEISEKNDDGLHGTAERDSD